MPQLSAREGLPVFGDPGKFNRLVGRHGQYVRWYRGNPCHCLLYSGAADPSCDLCRGVGINYSLSTEVVESRVFRGLGVNWIDLQDLVDINSLLEITEAYYSNQISLTVDSIDPTWNRIIFTEVIPKHARVFITYRRSLINSYNGSATLVAEGVIEVPIGIENEQGFFENSIYTINSATYSTDVITDEPITVDSFYKNNIFTTTVIPSGASIIVNCTFIEPIIVSIVSVNAIKVNKNIDGAPITAEVDGYMSYPQLYSIGHTDLIATTSAHLIDSVVSKNPAHVILPAYEIEKIIRVEDVNGEITGAVIEADNRIRWTGSTPTGAYSVVYSYNPVFQIVDREPNLRNYENKLYPKRVGIKRRPFQNLGDNRPTASTPIEDRFYG